MLSPTCLVCRAEWTIDEEVDRTVRCFFGEVDEWKGALCLLRRGASAFGGAKFFSRAKCAQAD